jgi:hypothetical protein
LIGLLQVIKYAGVFANSSSQREARTCCSANKKQAGFDEILAELAFTFSSRNIKIFYTEGGESVYLKACREARDPSLGLDPPHTCQQKPNPSLDLESIKTPLQSIHAY